MADLVDELGALEQRLKVLERTELSSASASWQAATVDTYQARTDAAYGDCVTVGPTVTTTVTESGILLVGLAATYFETIAYGGHMSFTLSGANTLAADDIRSVFMTLAERVTSTIFVLSGLTPGATTITAKYRSRGYPTDTGYFSYRQLAGLAV